MSNDKNKQGLAGKYEVGLMVISIAIIIALVAGLTAFPVRGKEVAASLMYLLTNHLVRPYKYLQFLCFYS